MYRMIYLDGNNLKIYIEFYNVIFLPKNIEIISINDYSGSFVCLLTISGVPLKRLYHKDKVEITQEVFNKRKWDKVFNWNYGNV